MDLFYGLRSLKHTASYAVGPRSILRGGVPKCDLGPKDRAYFEHLRDDEKQRYEDECAALQALAEGQQYHAAREGNWAQYQALNDSAKAHRIGTRLDRKIAQAQHAGTIAEKKRTHRELLAATREANDRAKYRTVNVHSQTVPDESAQHEGQQQQQWGL